MLAGVTAGKCVSQPSAPFPVVGSPAIPPGSMQNSGSCSSQGSRWTSWMPSRACSHWHRDQKKLIEAFGTNGCILGGKVSGSCCHPLPAHRSAHCIANSCGSQLKDSFFSPVPNGIIEMILHPALREEAQKGSKLPSYREGSLWLPGAEGMLDPVVLGSFLHPNTGLFIQRGHCSHMSSRSNLCVLSPPQ